MAIQPFACLHLEGESGTPSSLPLPGACPPAYPHTRTLAHAPAPPPAYPHTRTLAHAPARPPAYPYACTLTRKPARPHAHTYMHMHACMYASMYASMHVCTVGQRLQTLSLPRAQDTECESALTTSRSSTHTCCKRCTMQLPGSTSSQIYTVLTCKRQRRRPPAGAARVSGVAHGWLEFRRSPVRVEAEHLQML
eukprot:360354-Chlamydomonas_euryale.AAC.6